MILSPVGTRSPWQQPDNPDPKSINLRLLARVLRSFLSHWTGKGATYAVFLDFLSLFQKGPNGEERTEAEAALFKLALSDMMVWYAHPKLITLKLTQLPLGYPAGFSFPSGMQPNTAGYFERGWCFCESSVSNLRKSYDFVLDLGKLRRETTELFDLFFECTAKRDPPLLPADFRLDLAAKSFTSKKADEETVANLYETTFKKEMGEAEVLRYEGLQWGDKDVIQLSKVLASSGSLPNLEWLRLDYNQIGEEGVKALSDVIAGGSLPDLKTLELSMNKIGDEGAKALSDAIAGGSLPNLEHLHLSSNKIGDEGAKALSDVIAGGTLPKLRELHVDNNKLSLAGKDAIKVAADKRSSACYV